MKELKELYPGIYLKVLKFHHKNSSPLNLYVIRGGERSLMIDTGYHFDYCLEAVEELLTELEIGCGELDVFITHNHPDHVGLARVLADRGARIFMNPEDAVSHSDMVHCCMVGDDRSKEILRLVGITRELTPEIFGMYLENGAEEDAKRPESPEFPFEPAAEGQEFCYGPYRLRTVKLKGHTIGQMGLYEAEKKLFFCGDQIMEFITPIVGSLYPDIALLGAYMRSMWDLKHIYGDCTLLPGHFGAIRDVRKEVDRIVFSYLDKCELMKHILEHGRNAMTVRQVGMLAYGRAADSLKREGLVTFSLIMAKTFSCLEYLYMEGFASRTEEGGTLYWSA